MPIKVLREAAYYLTHHKSALVVINLPFIFFEANAYERLQKCIRDIALLHTLGIKIIITFDILLPDQCLVRKEVMQVMNKINMVKLQLESLFSLHRNSTTRCATPVVSGNFVTARPKGVIDGVDYSYIGKIRRIDIQHISTLLNQELILLIAPIGFSPSGENFILEGKDTAVKVAAAIHADKLIFIEELFDKLPRELDLKAIKVLIQKVTSQSLRYLLQMAEKACEKSIKRTYLLDQNIDGVLLLELLTRDGVGSMLTEEAYDEVRTANLDDIAGIIRLIAPLEAKKVLVKRSREVLEQEIENYQVILKDGLVIACAAFLPYPEEMCAELSCLAVHQDYQGNKHAQLLLSLCEKVAQIQKMKFIFVLTTQTTDWFIEHGFILAELKDLPVAKQKLYNYQRNSKILIKILG